MNCKISDKKINETITVVTMQGEIDVYTAPRVKNWIHNLIDQGFLNLIINLEKVSYIDAPGNGILIGFHNKIEEKNGFLGFICTNPQIKKIFNITGLINIFEIYQSEEEALTAI